jgi:hypothetical protein
LIIGSGGVFDDPETPCIEGCRGDQKPSWCESRSYVSHVGTASPSRVPDAGLVSEWRAGAVEAAARPVPH